MNVFVSTIQQSAEADIRAALGRAVASTVFATSPRLIAFLRYVVERTLAGETACLKGYTIAVEALGRPPSFDPQTDPIVRVEAGRLRRALARFYSEEGRDELIAIELPLGSYVPNFHRCAVQQPSSRADVLDGRHLSFNAHMLAAPRPSWMDDGAALHAALEQLLERQRLRVREIMADIQITKMMLQRSRELLRTR